jgi:hypothetical protein
MSRYFDRLASRSELTPPMAARVPIAAACPAAPESQPMPLEEEAEVHASPLPPTAQPVQPLPVPREKGRAALAVPRSEEHNRHNHVRAAAAEAVEPSPERALPPEPSDETPGATIEESCEQHSSPVGLRPPPPPAPSLGTGPGGRRRSQPRAAASGSPTSRPSPLEDRQAHGGAQRTGQEGGAESSPVQALVVAAKPQVATVRAGGTESQTPALFGPSRPRRERPDRHTETTPLEIHIGSIALAVHASAPAALPAQARSESAPPSRFSLHRHYLRWE